MIKKIARKKIIVISLGLLILLGAISWLIYGGIVPNPFLRNSAPPLNKQEFIEYIMTAPVPAASSEAKKRFLEQVSNNPPPTPEEVRQLEDQKREFVESLNLNS